MSRNQLSTKLFPHSIHSTQYLDILLLETRMLFAINLHPRITILLPFRVRIASQAREFRVREVTGKVVGAEIWHDCAVGLLAFKFLGDE
jgi:hypothetical protein